MIVWDQNWYERNEKGEGLVGMHKIAKTGYGGVSDANAYYVIRV